jgi:hypothetical protein
VTDEERAKALAGLLGLSDPREVEALSRSVMQVRESYRAREPGENTRLRPAATERLLAGIARSIERKAPVSERAARDPGVLTALRNAGVDAATDLFNLGKISWAQRKGSRKTAEELLEAERLRQALPYIYRALNWVRTFKQPTRGREGVELGRTREDAKAQAVQQLAGYYPVFAGERATRGGRDGPSRFERFLELAIGDLTGGKGPALAKRWARITADGPRTKRCSTRCLAERERA